MANESNTVLIVEDDDNDVQLLRRAFKKANLSNSLQVVNNGDEACRYLAGANGYRDRDKYPLPIVVLLDLKLPRRSGHEVLRWLRGQPEPVHRVPVVVLTSSRESTDLNQAYDLGANSYLVKPVEFSDLLRLVESLHIYWLMLNEQPDLTSH